MIATVQASLKHFPASGITGSQHADLRELDKSAMGSHNRPRLTPRRVPARRLGPEYYSGRSGAVPCRGGEAHVRGTGPGIISPSKCTTPRQRRGLEKRLKPGDRGLIFAVIGGLV